MRFDIDRSLNGLKRGTKRLIMSMPFSIRLGSLISSFQFREDVVRSTLKDFKPEPPNGLPNLRIFCAGRTAYVGYAVTIAARMRCEQDFPLHARAVSQRALSSSLVVGAKTAAVSPWKYSPRRPRSPKFSTGSETLRLAVDLYKVKDSAAVSLTCLLPAFDSLDQKSRHLPA